MSVQTKKHWYVGGLHFQCNECGQCCSGPGEGYIWVHGKEIEFIADYLKTSVSQLRKKYLRRIGLRTSITENSTTKDCIFLERSKGKRFCRIYNVRPNQCRTWPFWSSNLKSINTWNEAAQKCRGINRGRIFSYEEIEKTRKSKKWWTNGSTDDTGSESK
jgi:Fe-S-cluster containining protein